MSHRQNIRDGTDDIREQLPSAAGHHNPKILPVMIEPFRRAPVVAGNVPVNRREVVRRSDVAPAGGHGRTRVRTVLRRIQAIHVDSEHVETGGGGDDDERQAPSERVKDVVDETTIQRRSFVRHVDVEIDGDEHRPEEGADAAVDGEARLDLAARRRRIRLDCYSDGVRYGRR